VWVLKTSFYKAERTFWRTRHDQRSIWKLLYKLSTLELFTPWTNRTASVKNICFVVVGTGQISVNIFSLNGNKVCIVSDNKIILLFCFGHYPLGPEFQWPVRASRLGQTVTAYGNVRRRGIRLWGTSGDYRDGRGIVRFYTKLLLNITDAVYLIVPRDSLKYATIFYIHTTNWPPANLNKKKFGFFI